MKIQSNLKIFFINFIHNKNNIIFKTINFIILFIILFTVIIFHPPTRRLNLHIDDVLTRDIIANEDITYIDKSATEKNEELIKITTPPIFVFDEELNKKRKEEIVDILNIIYNTSNFNELNNALEKFHFKLSFNEYQTLINLNLFDANFIDKFFSIFNETMDQGIIAQENPTALNFEITGIVVKKYENKKLVNTHYSIDQLKTLDSITPDIENKINQKFSQLKIIQKKTLLNIYSNLLIPNIIYNKELSDLRLSNRIKSEAPVFKKIKKGQVIARKGDLITQDYLDKIEPVLNNKKSSINLPNLISIVMILLFILLFIYYFIKQYEKTAFDNFRNYIFISAILVFNVIYFSIPIYFGYDKSSIYIPAIIPISAYALSLLFLYSRIFSAFFTILLSFLYFFISGFNIFGFMFISISGFSSVFVVSKIDKRIDLLSSGLKIAIINLLLSVFLIFSLNPSEIEIPKFLIYSVLNGIFSAIFAIGIILLGETIINTPTVFKLQELAQSSSPLLKQLFNTAIGTYNHSIIVGNLAEAAAIAIHSNGLLAKVGGYYHDIGKLDNPEYFIENQLNFNKHELLKPSISTAIIKSHVKIGIDLAKKYRLPQKVIDIIEQHHGNTLIKYFYEEAIKNFSPDKEEIQKIDYHYQNKNPQFPEAAIVLMADQVEAATRSLKKYTMTNIEKIIEKIVDDKFQEGILDDSGLTLKNITKIKKIFCKVITGMYHPRIEYPTSNLENENARRIILKSKQRLKVNKI